MYLFLFTSFFAYFFAYFFFTLFAYFFRAKIFPRKKNNLEKKTKIFFAQKKCQKVHILRRKFLWYTHNVSFLTFLKIYF